MSSFYKLTSPLVPIGRPQLPSGGYLRYGLETSDECRLKISPNHHFDYIICSGKISLFSEAAFDVLRASRLQSELYWVPVAVEVGHITHRYQGLTTLVAYDVVDLDQCDIDWMLPGKVIREISKWHFKFPPAYDFFMAANSQILVSDGLKTSFEAARLTGLEFEPINVA